MGTSYDGALYAKYKNGANIFIETGAYIGDGIQGALSAGFDKIISIELAKCQYDFCVNRFRDNEKVSLILGDTRQLLSHILIENSIKYKEMFFWLDAHCSGGTTEGDSIDITLPQELKIIFDFIQKYNIQATLAIDDVSQLLENDVGRLLEINVIEIIENNNSYIIGKEPSINPFTNFTEIDSSIIIARTNA